MIGADDRRAGREIVQVKDAYYIHATSSRIDDRTQVLQDGDTFAVVDRLGDVHPYGRGQQGVYHQGTRFLSLHELELQGERPLLLSSTVRNDNSLLAVDLANPDLERDRAIVLPANVVHVHRALMLHEGTCHVALRVRSFAAAPVEVALTLRHGADFRDIFEVRGTARPRRGRLLEPEVAADRVVLRYEGLDDRVRTLTVWFDPVPERVTAHALGYTCRLEPGADQTLHVAYACSVGGAVPVRVSLRDTVDAVAQRVRVRGNGIAEIATSSEQCDAWLHRSFADLRMVLADKDDGPYPYAGVPWYCTVFGRDGLLTAYACLVVAPHIARGVLSHLAALQATEHCAERDAEPGKILHESREGEMAALREIPFGRYYGSVDSTPLFALLAGAYWRRTGDLEFARRLWPHVEAALGWIDANVAAGGDGEFVRYRRQASDGLVNQGWKDSGDAVSHADGELARGAVALCEVQAYVYAARLAAAQLADALGEGARARELRGAAERLRGAFERDFWCEEIGTYALAIDGERRRCAVRSSNTGHLLFTGIAGEERARRVVATLLGEDMWSGWGIRTLSAQAPRFNPMSYHNGSVWPHDNALAAHGFARLGFKAEAAQVFAGMLGASTFLELNRLPELFCGFARRPGEGPTLYPVACSPQAWAAASAFLLVQSCLGIDVDAAAREIVVDHPQLPEGLERIALRNVALPGAVADLHFTRQGRDDVGVAVTRVRGDLRVRILK